MKTDSEPLSSTNQRPDLRLIVPESEPEGIIIKSPEDYEQVEGRVRRFARTILGPLKRFHKQHLALVKPEMDKMPWETPGFSAKMHAESLRTTAETIEARTAAPSSLDRHEPPADSFSEPKD